MFWSYIIHSVTNERPYLPEVGSSRKIIEGFDASSTAMDNLNEEKRKGAHVRWQ